MWYDVCGLNKAHPTTENESMSVEPARQLTPDEIKTWSAKRMRDAWERAKTGADLVLHGAVQGLIDEGIFDDQREAHLFIARAMITELDDHDLLPGKVYRDYAAAPTPAIDC